MAIGGSVFNRKVKKHDTVLLRDNHAYRMLNKKLYRAEFNADTDEIGEFLPIDENAIMDNKDLLAIYLALYE